MQIHYYKTNVLAEAFEQASRDTQNWSFPEMEALAQLAAEDRAGTLTGVPHGNGGMYFCSRGTFIAEFAGAKGYGISMLQMPGREAGVADPVASEILEFHRDRPNEELFAEQLLTYAEHVTDIVSIDRGYDLLIRAGFLVRTNSNVQVTTDGGTVQRPKYRLRRPGEMLPDSE